MLALFDKIIREQLLIQKTDHILLAVSGGLDSMCLVELFDLINQPISIAHCNYRLRGSESEQDAEMVSEVAHKKGIQFFLKEFDIDKTNGSIQVQARDLRYSWFKDLMNQHTFDYVATAHHLDDQIETFLINLIRGTGIEGLSGIQAKSNKIIRPLLHVTKTELTAWGAKHQVAFREDSSNITDDYLRNRMRHHVVPAFKKENPDFYNGFKRTLKKLNQTKSILLEKVKSDKSKLTIDGEYKIIDLLGFDQEHAELSLFHILKSYGITWTQVENICSNKHKSGLIFQSSAYEVLLDRNRLLIKKIQPENRFHEITVNAPVSVEIPDIGTVDLEPVTTIESLEYSDIEYLDAEKVNWPIKIRGWRPGDQFAPLGMNGKRQKLQDFFSNKKINRFDKSNILLIEDSVRIICILGHRLSDHVKITDTSKAYYRLRFTRKK